MEQQNKRYCLYCNAELKGRADKRFCDSQCKSAYHNKTQNSNEAFIKKVNKQLRKNRRALRHACPQGKAIVKTDFLTSLGMNFTFMTHIWKSSNNNIYYFCYDYGYTKSREKGKVVVIQKQDYMDF